MVWLPGHHHLGAFMVGQFPGTASWAGCCRAWLRHPKTSAPFFERLRHSGPGRLDGGGFHAAHHRCHGVQCGRALVADDGTDCSPPFPSSSPSIPTALRRCLTRCFPEWQCISHRLAHSIPAPRKLDHCLPDRRAQWRGGVAPCRDGLSACMCHHAQPQRGSFRSCRADVIELNMSVDRG